MNGKHALSISLAVAVAAIAGTLAATKTIHLGSNAVTRTTPASPVIAQRSQALDRTELALRKALSQRPPKLPPLPGTTPAPVGGPVAPPQAGRVVYVRPAPIIHTIHRSGGEHEGDREAGGGSHREGGGFDD